MSISRVDKIDLVTRSKEKGNYTLIIVADEPWEDSDEFRYMLQEKINSYVTYFLDGQMKKEYADCKQNRITIKISSTVPIPGHVLTFLSKISEVLYPHGVEIEIEIL